MRLETGVFAKVGAPVFRQARKLNIWFFGVYGTATSNGRSGFFMPIRVKNAHFVNK